MRAPITVAVRAGLTCCIIQQRTALSRATPVACVMKLSTLAAPPAAATAKRPSLVNGQPRRIFSTTMTPPPPQPATPSQPPPSANIPTTTSSPSDSTIPKTGLPYTRRAANVVSNTVPDPITAADEGAACPTVLSQVEHTYTLPHPLWKPEQVGSVHPVHRLTESTLDSLAYWTITTIRFNFDLLSGWKWGIPTADKALTRFIFLESIAGVPGSVAGLLRHLASLRRMKRDYGWIHTLLEEAENERMHLLTFLQMKQPGPAFRSMVWLSQGVFFNFFFLAYLASPKFCHRVPETHTFCTFSDLTCLLCAGCY